MSDRFKNLFRAFSLVILLASFIPVNQAVQAAATLPPVDMFQLPWDQGIAWMAIDGIDDGTKRPVSSSHHYSKGGAIDFAPRATMFTGEDTSNFWVTAAAAGIVIETSSCHIRLAHEEGWITEYQFLGNIQVKLGDTVARNQRLGIIADGVKYKYCSGYQEINVPHLHFMLRPSLIGATFAGWEVRYNTFWNNTTFRKGTQTVGLFKPLLNAMEEPAPTSTPTIPPTATLDPSLATPTPGGLPTNTPDPFASATSTPFGQVTNTPDPFASATSTPFGQFTNTPDPLASATPTPFGQATNTPDPFATATPTPFGQFTNTPDPFASATPTPFGQFTNTPDPFASATPTPFGQFTNTPDPFASATPTPFGQFTNTPDPFASATPTPFGQATNTPDPFASATPTPFGGPFVSTTVDPASLIVGGTGLASVRLHNVPAAGYASAEFTCTSNPALVETSNIAVTNLFGADAVTVINAPQAGTFIVAIAGAKGNKATTDGVVFTFNVRALQAGQTTIDCAARVSSGNQALTPLPSSGAVLTILELTPTPTLTPTVPPAACDQAEFLAHVTVPPGTVVSPGTTFTKTWRLMNSGTCDWTTSYQLVFFSGELMGAPSSIAFPRSVLAGQTVDISLNLTAPLVAGSYRGNWMLKNANGQLFGIGPQANEPFFVDIVVSDQVVTATPTSPVNDWLVFTNHTYGFQFQYPPQGVIADGQTDDFARIDLPIVQGTNLSEKYLEVIPALNANPCQSPLAAQSMLETSEIVVINGISFLKQTGGDAGAGNIYQWVAYSTQKDNVCVSLNFILHSHNPGVYATPPPVFDYAAESAVFGQIVETFTWLALPTATPGEAPTATPVFTSTPAGSPIPVFSPTPTPPPFGMLTGQVLASKPVTINLFNPDDTLAATISANPDGTFSLTVPPGNYAVIATASGCLGAQASITVSSGATTTLSTFALPPGDIDNNGVIDQFDVMTVGMSYNTSTPSAADLNNDGIINVLDLELLAQNYRKTGPVAWE